ncbi:PAS domain-containing sensor histidine kinase [Novosphingobium pentaromativorans]|uniref:Sensor protein FixL n=1 Tax=Novosphingobium pentaromativorans US6-1 TaxID=1088721 RepID=G6EK84_9SPHN|nr:PAS domain S-box protein [Novosphingobium pentaromativorans]EHJ58302.1 multi-sensor signal transduction histidine kinase [Novosphingobium pentaromativorans US6-1]
MMIGSEAQVRRSQILASIITVAAVLIAVVARYTLKPWLVAGEPYFLFCIAVLVAAVAGGARQALLAAILSIVAATLLELFEPSFMFDTISVVTALALAGGIILFAGGNAPWQRRSRKENERVAARLREGAAAAEELNLLVDGAEGYAIYMLDPEGRVTIWNEGAERLKGWSEAEIVGEHCSVFYPVDAVEAGKPGSDLARARELGKFEEEDWRVRKDGSEFLGHVSITALYNEEGALRGFGKVVRDATQQRAAESALQANASHLRSILATVPDAMVVIDEQGSIISFSTAAEKLFGYTEAEVVGSNVSRLMPSPDKERHDGYLERYLTSGERRIIGIGRVVLASRSDGSTFPMELSVGEAISDKQRVFTGFIRDLSERQETQERLEELQSKLIHVARVSAMGTMASTLAHELNQPITAVANYVEAVRDLLAEGNSDDLPMITEALNDAAGEAIRAGQIVRRLRDFVARGEVEKTVENLPDLIAEAAALGLIGAKEKGVRSHFDFDTGAVLVLVDKVQIQQVLINLVRNAVEAMASSPERQIWVCTRQEDSGMVRVTVADTGPGVAEHVARQLFTAFVTTKSEGMGLGLSICRTIVEANGGRIFLEPRKGGGSQFHFTLVGADPEAINDG